MNALLSSPVSVWAIAAISTLGVITRPFRFPEAVWAVLGALALCGLGMLPWSDALAAVGKGLDVYLFLTGMMVASELARKEGLFDYLAALAAKRAAWLTALRRDGIEVTAWSFLKLGIVVTLPALVTALGAVALGATW